MNDTPLATTPSKLSYNSLDQAGVSVRQFSTVKSKTLTIRLSIEETEKLASLMEGNATESIRYLIVKEWNRRRGKPAPRESEYRSDMRVGRPAADPLNPKS
jgi:hypothetical protein